MNKKIKKVRMSFSIDEETFLLLEKKAKKAEISNSGLVAYLVTKGLGKEMSQNDNFRSRRSDIEKKRKKKKPTKKMLKKSKMNKFNFLKSIGDSQ